MLFEKFVLIDLERRGSVIISKGNEGVGVFQLTVVYFTYFQGIKRISKGNNGSRGDKFIMSGK
jgi:hypothetical protein